MERSGFSEVANRIRAWNGDDCQELQVMLRDVLRLKRENMSFDVEPLMEEIDLALADVATRDDAPWPSPWDEDGGHDFAEVCDRRGQYIHTDWRNCNLQQIDSHNFVRQWEPGIDCEFG